MGMVEMQRYRSAASLKWRFEERYSRYRHLTRERSTIGSGSLYTRSMAIPNLARTTEWMSHAGSKSRPADLESVRHPQDSVPGSLLTLRNNSCGVHMSSPLSIDG
jgi:hypothetical protein